MGLRDHIPRSKTARIGEAGRKSERNVGKSLGAKLRPASGAMQGAKGDMALQDVLIESKSTVNASISVRYSWLGKISTEALNVGKEPALTVSFTDQKGRALNYGEWVMIPLRVWQELRGE